MGVVISVAAGWIAAPSAMAQTGPLAEETPSDAWPSEAPATEAPATETPAVPPTDAPTDGASELSSEAPLATEAARTTSVPGAPYSAAATAHNGSLEVAWSPPVSDGGSPVLEYRVVATPRTVDAPEQAAVVPADGGTTATTVGSLVNGVTYDVTVTAANRVGSGLSAGATGTPRTVPQAPAIGAVVAGDGAARVQWTAPRSTGGAPVRAYVVRAVESGTVVQAFAGATEVRVPGLRNGTPTTFTVAAVNAAGKGPVSAKSASVTPRRVAKLVILRQPDPRIVYGTVTRVRAAVVAAGGVGLPRQRVELWARNTSASSWRRVAAGTTGSGGRVGLSATLTRSAALQLRHPAGVVAAQDRNVRAVAVAKRVTASSRRDHTRMGTTVVVRGRVAPDQRVGSEVVLQRRSDGAWVRAAVGRMTTQSSYVIKWRPERVGRYALRVARAGDDRLATGRSGSWRHRVSAENAADIANDILRNERITLATVHLSSGPDGATAKANIVDVANGRRARTSCFGNAPCSSTRVTLGVLRAVRAMGQRGSVTISEVAGGSHAPGSAHYNGRALDITWVNGRHVGYGSNYGQAADACRAFGAGEIYTPSSDPWGGHSRHVHCAW